MTRHGIVNGRYKKRRLRWRSQFAPQPAQRFTGFHRVNKFDHALMDVTASRAFQCSDIKARPAGRDACQHGARLARGATWTDGHDARPCDQAGAQHSQSPLEAIVGPVIGSVDSPYVRESIKFRASPWFSAWRGPICFRRGASVPRQKQANSPPERSLNLSIRPETYLMGRTWRVLCPKDRISGRGPHE